LTLAAEIPAGTQDCKCFALRSAVRHMSQFYDQLMAPVGLRITQFSILAKLNRLGPMTINPLAKNMVMDCTTLGRNVLPLERDGLIGIQPSTSDRRAKELRLTKAGEKRLQQTLSAWSHAQKRFETSFGIRRAAELSAMLRTVAGSQIWPSARAADR
jgi:DNA-binding MarR family transcriptional regulator